MNKKSLAQVFDAMYHGKYDFNDFVLGEISGNYETIEIRKRLIHKPNKKLKTYHSFLNLFLFEYLNINNEVVFSYRKGLNVYDAISKHAHNKHFFQTDFTDFFKSLHADLIKKVILSSCDLSPISDINLYINRIVNLVTVDGVIPMGFPTSPLISNACLFNFDNKLQSYCIEQGLIYTRYSDDIIISSDNREKLFGVDAVVESIMKDFFENKLHINISKSKFTHVGNKIKLLGMVILPNGKITVDKKLREDIEVLLHFYINDREKFLDKVDGDHKSGVERISGYLNYVNTIDPSYLDKLRKKYGTTIVDMFIHKSVK
jgi:RNA-directed DNA polymerase